MIRKIVSLFIVLAFFSGFGYGAIPASERAVLIALYNSTNGDSWYYNAGWKTAPLHTDGFAMPGTEGSWYGIYLSGDSVNNISLYKNHLTGSIPAQLGNLSNLGYLNIGDNSIGGAIPAELGNLSHLEYLNLHDNDLIGGIPSQLGNLSNLHELRLYDNKYLGGNIPTQLGNLLNLIHLDLHTTNLSGAIPTQLANLTQLQKLYLNSNRLTGEIPSFIMNFPNLTVLDLCYNCLTCTNPAERAWLNDHDYRWGYTQTSCSTITPFIIVTSPNGGENWAAGTSHNITWVTVGPVGDLKIEYSTDSGASWNEIVSNYHNDWFYPWAVPNTSSSNCLIRINDDDSSTTGSPSDASNTVFTISSPTIINLNRSILYFGANTTGAASGAQTVYINNSGGGTLTWAASANASWLRVAPSSGSGSGTITVSVNVSGLSVGTYDSTVSLSSPNAINSPQSIIVSLNVYNPGGGAVPFGEFSTPTDGSTNSGSVPVTGWVLDDIDVSKVEIFNGDAYIGDAVFVEGARPDVEAAYPTYPGNYRAGWGYMLLTNFLPNAGNGSYTLYARATDAEGNQVTLGAKTITCDNAHAVKPFGALDTPAQGGTASGKKFINWGWVLTPLPNNIPSNGSTIDVWVDGMKKGHPTYNLSRPDIAALFPDYNNSNGAGGYFYLDTTAYENGIHTISWSATDNAGNSDGIGSRFFSIQNTGSDLGKKGSEEARKSGSSPARDWYGAVSIIKGYREDAAAIPQAVYPDENGIIAVEIKELERIEIHFQALPVNNLSPLPIGSTLDSGKGIFYWQPGPGFIGKYHLVFIEEENTGMLNRKEIIVNIMPGY